MDEKMEGVLGHGVLGSIDGVCSEKATAVLRPLLGDTILGPGQSAAVSSPAPFVGLYFSAAWCGPCRGFTPQLAKWYSESAGRDLLEIVFVSSDSDEPSFREYYGEMPWLALPFSKDKSDALSER